MKTLFFLMTFCVLVCFSCSKRSEECLPDGGLAGSWKWVRTDGGIGGHIHDTPASTGNNIYIQFTTANTYSIYTNGILSSQGTYSLEMRKCIHDHTNKNFIKFSSPHDQGMMIEIVDRSVMETSDDAYDGTISRYTRM